MEQKKVWMTYPPTGEVRSVDAGLESIHPLMVEGWSQCAAPESPAEAAAEEAAPGEHQHEEHEEETLPFEYQQEEE